MKVLKYIFIISIICILAQAARQDQAYKVDSKLPGVWDGSFISAQPQIGTDPSQFFLCGFGFREMKWVKSLWNCDCGRRWYRWKLSWRCNWCDNIFWTQSNAFKGIYCSYSDYNQQIQKITETGNKDSGKWRQYRCPKGQFASFVAVRNTGNQQGVDIGLNGMQMKCSNIDFSQNSVVSDNYAFPLSQLSKNKQGNFASSYKLKYEKNGKLLGIEIGFEGMPLISKVEIKYSKLDKIDVAPYNIDSVQTTNAGSTTSQQAISFNKTYTIKNTWTNEKLYTQGYQIQTSVSAQPMKLQQPTTYSTFTQKTQAFRFGSQIATTYFSGQQLIVLVPSCKKILVTSVIRQQKVNVPYEATLTFINRFTSAPIGTTVVKGIWNGVLASLVSNVITESAVVNCANPSPDINNLRSNS